ncbi:MAG TPA: bifunctional precorrin-2 dehydrogenase/sirohydrochlorin ferrochelatase [Candidatus Acidoferrum sp.]|nr:bifunctional precorrin-2 dehydrogenase/sirohydrochlorin ferrochelatase [Candidatus Acidoferrum sp.]
MNLFPIFLKLEGRLAVVAGGGTIAQTKISSLLQAGARVRIIAPEINAQLAALVRSGKVEWSAKKFSPDDLDGAFLTVAATSVPGVNEAVYRAAESRGILCNAVDDTQHSHFYYGAVVQRGDLQIAISTNGKSPALAQRLRKELEQQFGPEYEVWLEWLGAVRDVLRANEPASEETRKLLHALASAPSFERFLRESRRRPNQRGDA